MIGPAPWGDLDIGVGETLRHTIGDVLLQIRSFQDEFLIHYEYEHIPDVPSDREDPTYARFVTEGKDTLRLQPALPDRPVVLRPKSPIVILPGRWGIFYFSVPLWARFVSHKERGDVVMMEVPTANLSSTWFGDMETGQLCYAIDSRLLRSMPPGDEDNSFARCEVEIRNSSKENLRFERICVHVEHMHLYYGDGKFRSNRVRVVFKGAEQVSQLTFSSGPSQNMTAAEPVCEPREIMDNSILKRSFNLIREITGI